MLSPQADGQLGRSWLLLVLLLCCVAVAFASDPAVCCCSLNVGGHQPGELTVTPKKGVEGDRVMAVPGWLAGWLVVHQRLCVAVCGLTSIQTWLSANNHGRCFQLSQWLWLCSGM